MLPLLADTLVRKELAIGLEIGGRHVVGTSKLLTAPLKGELTCALNNRSALPRHHHRSYRSCWPIAATCVHGGGAVLVDCRNPVPTKATPEIIRTVIMCSHYHCECFFYLQALSLVG